MGTPQNTDVVVIGAGLAGGFTAHAFARRGATVTVLESRETTASRASGNRFALFTPYITTKPSKLETVYSAGFRFTRSLFSEHGSLARLFTRCGAVQLPATTRLQKLLASADSLMGDFPVRRVSQEEARDISGVSITAPGLYIPDGGYIDPRALVAALLGDLSPVISTITERPVVDLVKKGDTWSIYCSGGEMYHAKVVVICNAYEAAHLTSSKWLPLEPIRGQTVSARATNSSADLQTVVAFGGYITPAVEGSHVVGAHYRHDDSNESVSDGDTTEIMARCGEWLAALQLATTLTHNARVCFRTSTLDRLPYCGALPDFNAMEVESSRYQSGSDLERRVPLTYQSGLYINVGHGSRGLLSCPIAAEAIARMAFRAGYDELKAATEALDPARLVYRLLAGRRKTLR